jgi:hypothetical protein
MMEAERRYTAAQLEALAATAVAKIPGARLDSWCLCISIPNPAALHVEYTLPSGFRNAAAVRL